MKRDIHKITLSAIISALIVVIILLGTFIELLDITTAALCSLLVFAVMIEAKGKYPIFLTEALRMLENNGIIIADNILYKGYTLSDYNKHKQRTAVRGLREYLKTLEEMANMETEILEVGDGLAISKLKT